jgi:hypothetical protein
LLQQLYVVFELAEAMVAQLTQHAPELTGLVIMIGMEGATLTRGLLCATYGALAFLL